MALPSKLSMLSFLLYTSMNHELGIATEPYESLCWKRNVIRIVLKRWSYGDITLFSVRPSERWFLLIISQSLSSIYFKPDMCTILVSVKYKSIFDCVAKYLAHGGPKMGQILFFRSTAKVFIQFISNLAGVLYWVGVQNIMWFSAALLPIFCPHGGTKIQVKS